MTKSRCGACRPYWAMRDERDQYDAPLGPMPRCRAAACGISARARSCAALVGCQRARCLFRQRAFWPRRLLSRSPNTSHAQEEDEEEEQAPERGEAGNHGVYDDDDGGLEDSGPDDLTCAICLGQIQPLDLALVKGCEHQYCGGWPRLRLPEAAPARRRQSAVSASDALACDVI